MTDNSNTDSTRNLAQEFREVAKSYDALRAASPKKASGGCPACGGEPEASGSCHFCGMAREVKLGRIWWSADNAAQAASMKEKYLKAGATDVCLEPEDDRPIVDVYITLDRARAKEILGVEPGPEEWMPELTPNASAVYEAILEMADQHDLTFDADGIRDTVEQTCRVVSIALTEPEIVSVCDEVLLTQSAQQTKERDRG
jgi:hypothetical protein